MEKNSLQDQLDRIERLLNEQTLLKKQVLNFNEAADYIDVSRSNLYKMTSDGKVPFYKPNGKKLYFNRLELDKWLLRNKQESEQELDELADEYINKKGRVAL